MEADIPNIISKLLSEEREGVKVTQSLIASEIGGRATQSLVSKWARGTKPEGDMELRIIDLAVRRGLIESPFGGGAAATSTTPPVSGASRLPIWVIAVDNRRRKENMRSRIFLLTRIIRSCIFTSPTLVRRHGHATRTFPLLSPDHAGAILRRHCDTSC